MKTSKRKVGTAIHEQIEAFNAARYDDVSPPPRVVYRLYWRSPSLAWPRKTAWRYIHLDISEELSFPRTMPAYALLPAVLSTYLHDNKIEHGDYQLRAVHETTGELIAVTTIGESL